MTGPPAELVHAVRGRDGRREGEEERFRCPYPDRHKNGDANPSARYHHERHVWCCDVCGAGGGWRDLCALLGVEVPQSGRSTAGRPRVTALYEYRDEQGTLLRRKLRWEPGFKGRDKSFTWEKPDGPDRWTKCKGDGNPRVLYGSEKLPAAREAGSRLLVVEGEKDANRAGALGLVAVCNPEGAGKGKWKAAYSEQLRGLSVVVIADRDAPGRAHAASVEQSLQGRAASVQLLELPGECVKDLSDWVTEQERQGAEPPAILAELEALLDAVPPPAGGTAAGADPVAGVLEALLKLDDSPDLGKVEGLLRGLGEAAAELGKLAREVVRERAVQALSGKVQAPGRLVDAALREAGGEAADTLQGRALSLDDPEPWPEAVDGGELLTDLEAAFRRFLVLVEGAAPALALWTLHTYAHGAAPISPILGLTSPEKRCGKTTLISLLLAVVRRPLPASNITPAALFRAVEKYGPTLLIDEADTFLREREELQGILNSGHTRETAFVVRTVGDEHEARCFSTWSPKAIALIGRLPPTLEDRSIPIAMMRKAPGETVERLRLDRLGELADLRRRALRWALDRERKLRRADPEVPAGLHDRAADNWRPLLAIADDAGGAWPAKARAAARALSACEDGDSSARVQLLADIQAVLEERGTEQVFTEDLLTDLTGDESRPWGEWKRGKPLTPISLARLLKPLGVKPRKIRIGEETRQGYRAEDLADALARYLPAPATARSEPEHPEHLSNGRAFHGSPSRNTGASVPARESAKPPSTTGVVPGVPAQNPGTEAEGDPEREVFEL